MPNRNKHPQFSVLMIKGTFDMKKTFIILTILAGILLCAVGYGDSRHKTQIGHRAPALVLERPGKRVSLEDLAGRYVILNFWSSTDGLSRKSTNEYTAWIRRNPDAPVSLVSVNFDSNRTLFNEIVRRDSLLESNQFYVGGDTARALADNYGLKNGYGTLLIDPQGVIVAHNPTEAQLTDFIIRRKG